MGAHGIMKANGIIDNRGTKAAIYLIKIKN